MALREVRTDRDWAKSMRFVILKLNEAATLSAAVRSGGEIQTNKGGVIRKMTTEEAGRIEEDAMAEARAMWNDLVDEARRINSAGHRKRFAESMAPKN